MKWPLKVGIIGAGAIAQGFDDPVSPNILTLAHAISVSPHFELGGFFDVDTAHSQLAEQKWACPATPRDRHRWLDSGWDVICIATPDEHHASDLADALAAKPLGIVIEKPLTMDADEGARLLQMASESGIPVIVDYSRRWQSATARVSGLISQGVLGAPLSVVMVYSGSAPRSVSHMLDLFVQWWGADWKATGVDGPVGRVALTRGDERVELVAVRLPVSHYVWELSIFCAAGKVELTGSPEKLEVCALGPHPFYKDFTVLSDVFSAPMESEPLLSRLFDTLSDAIRRPERVTRINDAEAASVRFVSEVLRVLA